KNNIVFEKEQRTIAVCSFDSDSKTRSSTPYNFNRRI
ncbi:unnamed protein product, partial [Allacma fusca]